MGINSEIIYGHDLLAVERFKDATHHMIIFDVLSRNTPYGEKGQRMRLFLSDYEYSQAQTAHKQRYIKILRHASVIEGHIVPDKKRKRRNARK